MILMIFFTAIETAQPFVVVLAILVETDKLVVHGPVVLECAFYFGKFWHLNDCYNLYLFSIIIILLFLRSGLMLCLLTVRLSVFFTVILKNLCCPLSISYLSMSPSLSSMVSRMKISVFLDPFFCLCGRGSDRVGRYLQDLQWCKVDRG